MNFRLFLNDCGYDKIHFQFNSIVDLAVGRSVGFAHTVTIKLDKKTDTYTIHTHIIRDQFSSHFFLSLETCVQKFILRLVPGFIVALELYICICVFVFH